MNRQIKFRAYCPDSKLWFYWGDFAITKHYITTYFNGDFYFEGKEKVILQQFIGIIDSHGHEVYEGDILSIKYNKVFSGAKEGFFEVKWDKTHYSPGYWQFVETMEILGNIFENPELLK